jgi:DNA mismatch endonuclease (patch repair protein)
MSRVRHYNTEPELLIRKILYANGIYYRLHRKDLPGTPDIVISSAKLVVFVNGCLWHGHDNCYSLPKTNTDFWKNKIERNIRRDQKNKKLLRQNGWSVITIWQCELTKKKIVSTGIKLINRIKKKQYAVSKNKE